MQKLVLIGFAIFFAAILSCENDKSPMSNPNTAFLRIVHTAADPTISVIDIYVNGEKFGLLDNFPFGSMTANIEIPAGTSADVILANQNSSSVSDHVIASFNTIPLEQGSKYIMVITGVTDPMNFTNPDPSNRNIDLQFHLISNVRENSVAPSVVDLLVFHSSTDAPQIDILANGTTPPLVDNLDFREQTNSYISVDPTISKLDVTPASDNSTLLSSFSLNLASFAGKTVFLFASGFLNVSQNQNGPAFKLLASSISTAGGKMVEPQLDYSQITDIIYSQHIQPVFQENCLSCHSGGNASRGLRLDSWDNLIKGSDHGEAIIPFDSKNSLMIELLTKLVNGPHPQDQGANTLSNDAVEFLARWIDEGAKNDNDEVPYQNSTNRLYVCNQDAGIISVIDTDAKVVIRTIKLTEMGYSSTPNPHDVAVEPDGEHWYVSLIKDDKVLGFDKDFNLIGQADFQEAGLLAMHPTKDLLYVGHTLSIPGVPQDIGAITRSTMNLVPVPLLYERPHAFIADHAGRYVYSASLTQNRYGIIDTDNDPTELANVISFSSSHTLVQMNISPDDQEIYISSQQTGQLLVLDSSTPLTLTVIDSVTVGQQPWHPKFTPDGSTVYVGNNLSHTVSVVNATMRKEETTIGSGDGSDGLAEPHGLVISPSGQYVYVTNRNKNIPAEYTPRYDLGDNANSGTVVVINTATNVIEKVIEVEEYPSGIAIYEE